MSSVGAMIQRFREAKPMSRAEREAQKGNPTRMWWEVENSDLQNEKSRSDENDSHHIEAPRKFSIQPAIPSVVPSRYSHTLQSIPPYNDDYTASIDLDDLISKEISLLAKEMQRDDDNVEVKFAGSSSKSDNIGSSYDKLRSNNPPRFFNTSREGLNTIRESDDEYADYFSSRKAPNVRTSIRLDDILNSSVDTLGSTGFKALLLPELKLDGIKAQPEKKPEPEGNLNDVNVNMEELLKSLNDAREKMKKAGYLPEGVDETIPQITNKLNADMIEFKQQFESKYSEEDALEAERVKRDKEMKEAGRKEEREEQLKKLIDLDLKIEDLPILGQGGFGRNLPEPVLMANELGSPFSVEGGGRRTSGNLTFGPQLRYSQSGDRDFRDYRGPLNEMLSNRPPLLQQPQQQYQRSRSQSPAPFEGKDQYQIAYEAAAAQLYQLENGAREKAYQLQNMNADVFYSMDRRSRHFSKPIVQDEEGQSDHRKAFNPYPDLVHENIFSISKGICSILDVTMTTLNSRLPNSSKDDKPDKKAVDIKIPPSLLPLAAEATNKLDGEVIEKIFEPSSGIPSIESTEKRSESKMDSIVVDYAEEKRESIPESANPKVKNVKEQLDAMDNILGADNAPQSLLTESLEHRLPSVSRSLHADSARDAAEYIRAVNNDYTAGIASSRKPRPSESRSLSDDKNRVRFSLDHDTTGMDHIPSILQSKIEGEPFERGDVAPLSHPGDGPSSSEMLRPNLSAASHREGSRRNLLQQSDNEAEYNRNERAPHSRFRPSSLRPVISALSDEQLFSPVFQKRGPSESALEDANRRYREGTASGAAWQQSRGMADEPSAPPFILSGENKLNPIINSNDPFSIPGRSNIAAEINRANLPSYLGSYGADSMSPLMPFKRPIEGAAIRSLRSGYGDILNEYEKSRMKNRADIESPKEVRFSDDKENEEWRFRREAIPEQTARQKGADKIPRVMQPNIGSLHDKAKYLQDMKKLRERMTVYL